MSDIVGYGRSYDVRGRAVVDSRRVIAASGDRGALSATFVFRRNRQTADSDSDRAGDLIGFALTPGYETYRGLGWCGVMVRSESDVQGR